MRRASRARGTPDNPLLSAWGRFWLLQHSIGTSLWALRLLPALAGATSIILAGLLARQLGGRRWAMFLAALATLMAPVLLGLSHLFTMNAFDLVLWTAIACLIAQLANTGRQTRRLPYRERSAGITIPVGKYSHPLLARRTHYGRHLPYIAPADVSAIAGSGSSSPYRRRNLLPQLSLAMAPSFPVP